jgi:hypothetical protein
MGFGWPFRLNFRLGAGNVWQTVKGSSVLGVDQTRHDG